MYQQSLTPGQLRDQQEQNTAIINNFQGIRPQGEEKKEKEVLSKVEVKPVKAITKKIIRHRLALAGKTQAEIDAFVNVSREELAINLENHINDHFLKIGVTQDKIDRLLGHTPDTAALGLRKSVEIMAKMLEYLPTATEYAAFASLPVGCGCGDPQHCPKCREINFANLEHIKHPLLYDYSVEEIYEALQPWIKKHSASYCSNRYGSEDASNDGFIGILNAIKTDAGISPFTVHAYRWIRTSIRRRSAQSGTIKRAEKRPSKTEIRTAITLWLQGKVADSERQKIVDDAAAKGKLLTTAEIDTKVQSILRRYVSADVLNTEPLISDDSLEHCAVQKTAVKDAKAWLIKNSIRLDTFNLSVVVDLVNFLKIKFGYVDRVKSPITVYHDQFTTIADLVNHVAVSPDFHGNPLTIETGSDDEQSVGVALIAKEGNDSDRQEARSLVRGLIDKIELSPNQAVVQNKLFGLDGEEPVPGNILAKYFRKYTGEVNPTCNCGSEKCPECKKLMISRQRIAQNQHTIIKKWREAIWQQIEDDPHFYRMMHMLRKIVPLTEVENMIFTRIYGIGGTKLYEVKELAEKYEELTGLPTPEEWDNKTKAMIPLTNIDSKERFIRERLHDAQLKILREIY